MAQLAHPPARARGRARPHWTAAFLQALEATVTVTTACRAAGVPRRTAYNLRARDEGFSQAWDDAIEFGIEKLEREVYRRAIEGSDRLAMFLLRARRPEVYCERYQVRRAPAGQSVVNVDLVMNPKLRKAAAEFRRVIAAARENGRTA